MEERSKVFYRPARSDSLESGLVSGMLTVFEAAGLDKMVKPHDTVAIKTHCGEWNNTAYLRPVYARALADRIKQLGGNPFVCDTVTLPYNPYAARASTTDILFTAERNGFTPATLGCPFVVADGSGADDVRVELPEGFILKEAFIARTIAAADVLIVLTHFKGHPQGMFGGSIKNLGIGAQSQRGKFNVHMGGHPHYGLGASTNFRPDLCLGQKKCPSWQFCEQSCPWGLFEVTELSIKWDRDRCTGCMAHLGANTWCGVFDLPKITWETCNCAMADACLATVKAVGRDKVGFINMAIDITPMCDCVLYADQPVVPNLGVLAGKDPVALDTATKDLATASVGIPGSAAEDLGVMDAGMRKMEVVAGIWQQVSEELQINTGVLNGLGRREYQLIEVEPGSDRANFSFSPDQRQVGVRYARLQRSGLTTFPYDRFDGHGFDRRDEIDLALVRAEPAVGKPPVVAGASDE